MPRTPCCVLSCCRRSRVKITLPFRKQWLLVEGGGRGPLPGGVCLLSFIAVVSWPPQDYRLPRPHPLHYHCVWFFFLGSRFALLITQPPPRPTTSYTPTPNFVLASSTHPARPWIKLHFKSLILIWRGWQMDFCVNSSDKRAKQLNSGGERMPRRIPKDMARQEGRKEGSRKQSVGVVSAGRLFNLWLDFLSVLIFMRLRIFRHIPGSLLCLFPISTHCLKYLNISHFQGLKWIKIW